MSWGNMLRRTAGIVIVLALLCASASAYFLSVRPLSPDGTILTGGTSGSILTTAGTWTLDATVSAAHPGNYSTILNGTLQGGSSGADPSAAALYVLNGGILYQQTAANVWFSWTGAGPWVGPITDPRGGGGAVMVQHMSGSSSRYMSFLSPFCYRFQLAHPTIAGNALIVGAGFDNNLTPTVNDDVGNSYAIGRNFRDGTDGHSMAILGAFNVTAGARNINLCFPSDPGQNVQPVATEFANVTGFDGPGNGARGTGTTVSTASMTPTQIGDVVYQILTSLSLRGDPAGETPQSTYVPVSQANLSPAVLSADLFDGMAAQYGTYAATTAVAPSINMGRSDTWVSAAVLLKVGAAGNVPAPGTPRILHLAHEALTYNHAGFSGGSPFPNPVHLQFPTSGNLMVATVGGGNGACIVTGISSAGDTWAAEVPNRQNAAVQSMQMFYASQPAASSTRDIFLNWDTTTGDYTVLLYDIAGAASTPFDKSAGASGNNTTSLTLPTGYTITPAQNNEIVISIANWYYNLGVALNGQTFLGNTFDGSPQVNGPELIDQQGGYGYTLTNSLSTLGFTWQLVLGATGQPNSPGNWSSLSAAFKTGATIPQITDINPKTATFVVGTAGTVTETATMLSGAFTGTWSLSGTNAGSFNINATTGVLARNSTALAAGTYNINAIATQSGAVGSPKTQAIVITVNPAGSISPDGSIIAGGSGGSLTTVAGTWTFDPVASTQHPGNWSIMLNGVLQGGSSGADPSAAALWVFGGVLYQQTAAGVWWEYPGQGPWDGPVGDPRPGTIVGITPTTANFIGGTGSANTALATEVATMSSGSFGGTWSVNSITGPGTNSSSFVINSSTGVLSIGSANLAVGTYTLNVVATQAGVPGSPFTQAVTITGSAITTMPMLLGTYHADTNLPHFCAVVGRCPDFVIDNSYLGPGDTGAIPCSNSDGVPNYPLILDFPPLGPGPEFSDVNAAANGSYNGAYAQTVTDRIIPCANRIYAIRMASEWYLCVGGGNYYQVYWNFSNGQCDGVTQVIPPATFISMMRNLSTTIRTTLNNAGITHILLEWDVPKAANQTVYDIGSAYYDVGGADYYFDPMWLGNDPSQALNQALNQGLQFSKNFSTNAGKQFIIPESCNHYNTDTDPNGIFWNTLGPWLKANTVAYVYWNSEDGPQIGCPLSFSTPKLNGFITQLGNTNYNGTFWTHIPTPVPNPYQ